MDKLKQKRDELLAKMRAMLDKADSEKRDMTEEERAEFRGYEAHADYIDMVLKHADDGGDRPYRPTFRGSLDGRGMTDAGIFLPRKTWRTIFKREPRGVAGFKNFGEAIQALHNGNEEKLRELRTANTFTGTEGGYAVPEVTWAQIYDSGIEASATLDMVTPFPMTSDTLGIPAWDEDKTKGPIGSIEGEWIGETGSGTRKTPLLRLLKYEAHKLALFIACSSEVLQDSEAFSQSLAPLMRNSLAFSLDAAVLTGNGIAKPLGVLNSPATIPVSRTTANTIVFGDITNMMGRLLPSSLNRAAWLCSPSTFGTLVGMVTAAGSGELVMSFQPGASDFTMQILGRPVRVTEKLPAIGSKGGLSLVDLSYYGLAMRETGRFERTNAAQWTSDVIDFRLIIRADGRPLIAKPFVPAGGGSTLSPFVVLE